MGDLSEERLRKIASNWVRATDSEIREMASQLVGFMTAQATSAERVRSVVREAIMALLSERKLYIVEPQPPTMGEIALEAYGFGKACDAVALQGDELQALLATIADRIASQLTTPSSPTDIGRQRAASSAHASHVRDAVREAFVAVARLSTHSFPQRVVEDIA